MCFFIMNQRNNDDYNKEPVLYCKKCLSLRIMDVQYLDNAFYCDQCGATNVDTIDIEEWEKLYKDRYGHRFLENNY